MPPTLQYPHNCPYDIEDNSLTGISQEIDVINAQKNHLPRFMSFNEVTFTQT